MRTILTLMLMAAILLVGCSDGPAPGTDPVWFDDMLGAPDQAPTGWPDLATCSPLPGAAGRGGDLVVALAEPVAPGHAPVPLNDAERVLFAACYETLTRVTCTGRLAAGLAEAWEPRENGRRWRLRLRPDAVFWDGTPVTAEAVISAWARNFDITQQSGRPCPGLWIEPSGRGMVALSSHLLEIRLAEPQVDLPHLLAHPAMAVSARRAGWLWPVGSGPARLAADTDLPLPDLVCRPNQHHPEAPTWRTLTVRVLPDADQRDLLGADVDLTVIHSRAAVDYYAQLPDVRRTALPWSHKYVLLVPPTSQLTPASAVRLAAADVTVADGRNTERLTFRRCRPGGCPQLHGPTVTVFTPPLDPDPARDMLQAHHLYHLAGDADAAALAARVAARLLPDAQVRPLPQTDLARSLQDQEGAATIVRLDACYPTPCLSTAALLAHGPWLQAALPEDLNDPCEAARLLLNSGRALPLADTRAYLVWRGPLAGLALAHDGTPLLATLAVAAAEATP